METKEAKPDVRIELSKDTDVQDKRILGNKIAYEPETKTYNFILDSEFIEDTSVPSSMKFFPVNFNHN